MFLQLCTIFFLLHTPGLYLARSLCSSVSVPCISCIAFLVLGKMSMYLCIVLLAGFALGAWAHYPTIAPSYFMTGSETLSLQPGVKVVAAHGDLVAVSDESAPSRVTVYRLEGTAFVPVSEVDVGAPVTSLALSATQLAVGTESSLVVLHSISTDRSAAAVALRFPAAVRSVAMMGDRVVSVGSGFAHIHHAGTGSMLAALEAGSHQHFVGIAEVADGLVLLANSADGKHSTMSLLTHAGALVEEIVLEGRVVEDGAVKPIYAAGDYLSVNFEDARGAAVFRCTAGRFGSAPVLSTDAPVMLGEVDGVVMAAVPRAGGAETAIYHVEIDYHSKEVYLYYTSALVSMVPTTVANKFLLSADGNIVLRNGCPNRMYTDAQSWICAPCPAGSFASVFAPRFACSPCLENSVASEPFSFQCTECPTGFTAAAGHASCEKIPEPIAVAPYSVLGHLVSPLTSVYAVASLLAGTVLAVLLMRATHTQTVKGH